MININRINQNNEWSLNKPKIEKHYSTLKMRETNQSSGKVGQMIPFMFHECLPSEKVRLSSKINIQFTPWITNVLHEIQGDILYYFVPYRIVWEDWKKFITRCDENNDDTSGTLEIPLENYQIEEVYKQVAYKMLKGTGLSQKGKEMAEILYQYVQNSQASVQKPTKENVENWVQMLYQHIDSPNDNPTKTVSGITETVVLLFFDCIYKTRIDAKIMLETNWDYAGLPISINWVEFTLARLKTAQRKEKYPYLYYDSVMDWEKTKKLAENYKINKLNLQAYNKIYNDWIRLLDWEPKRNKDNIETATGNKNWDMFTRVRRYAMRGQSPTVPVTIDGTGTVHFQNQKWTGSGWQNTDEANVLQQGAYVNHNGILSDQNWTTDTKVSKPQIKGEDGLEGDWEITTMMSAVAMMNYFVANARIKPRYAEQLLARWGVQIQDARFQYAQLIGSNQIIITQDGITQTAPQIGESTLQGNITGQGWGNGEGYTKFYVPEHGVIIGLLQIKPGNAYELGIDPKWQHENTFDYPTPEFVNLPDRKIKLKEIVGWDLTEEEMGGTIGYKAIYDEYRTKVNRVTGIMRPSIDSNLKAHTLAIKYEATEANILVEKLVKANYPMDRIKQFIDQPDFLFVTQTNFANTLPLPAQNDVRVHI